jgi:hypothetical protein
MIPVITGYRGTTQVEITEGIKSGDTVLLTGLLSIKQGNKVKINKIIKN